eukprot:376544-Pelagomonas_calceolata.AAC.2
MLHHWQNESFQKVSPDLDPAIPQQCLHVPGPQALGPGRSKPAKAAVHRAAKALPRLHRCSRAPAASAHLEAWQVWHGLRKEAWHVRRRGYVVEPWDRGMAGAEA